jgi:nucleotide-binding universal stress UspA family protein
MKTRAIVVGTDGTDTSKAAVDWAAREAQRRRLLRWRGKYPDVPVEIVLTHDSAAAALVGLSSRAQLVIVGSHGHGLLAGVFLRSTGLQLLHHANCPVYIARPRPAAGAQ